MRLWNGLGRDNFQSQHFILCPPPLVPRYSIQEIVSETTVVLGVWCVRFLACFAVFMLSLVRVSARACFLSSTPPIPSHPVPSRPIPPHPVPSHSILSHPIISHIIPSSLLSHLVIRPSLFLLIGYPTLSYPILSGPITSYLP